MNFGCCLGQVPLRQRLQDYKSDKYMSPVAIDFVMACIAILVLITEDNISVRTQPLLTIYAFDSVAPHQVSQTPTWDFCCYKKEGGALCPQGLQMQMPSPV